VASVLVIEDEPNLRTLLSRVLDEAGFSVALATNGGDGLGAALAHPRDLVILDLMLPDISGVDVLRALLASRPDTPVLVLSSVPEIARRVEVLGLGAADFLAKPFANAELLARIKARLRPQHTPVPIREQRYLRGAGVELDLELRELLVDGRRIELPQREFVLLWHLLRRRGEICTRQELLAAVWGIEFDTKTNVVDVYVGRLRSKLASDNIETVRNVGYRFVA
jgi:DNA-binding response OmpR family regulator